MTTTGFLGDRFMWDNKKKRLHHIEQFVLTGVHEVDLEFHHSMNTAVDGFKNTKNHRNTQTVSPQITVRSKKRGEENLAKF